MKSLAMKKLSDPGLRPERNAKRERVRWTDLWVRIRFTRMQLLVFVAGLCAVAATVYIVVNFSSFQDFWDRRKAVEAIHTGNQLLSQVESMPGARSDLLQGARSQLQQAQNSLEEHLYRHAINFAQQGIDLLEEEVRWLKILETGRAARFERIEGSVQVRRPGSDDWETANPEMEIEEESEVRTGKDGQAKIRFDNGASTEITPDSLLIVRKLGIDTLNRTFENDVRLEQGEMEYRSQRRSDASQVDVPSGTFRTQGAVRVRAAYRQEDERPTALELLEGQGQFADLKGNLVALSPMTRVQVDASGSVSRPKAILLAPEPLAPPTASSLRFFNKEPVSVAFRWTSVEGAAAYQLEIAENNRFDRLLNRLNLHDAETKLDGLAAGIYWWRVRSIDSDGARSDPGPYRIFRIQIADQGSRTPTEGPKVRFDRVKLISRNSVLVEGSTVFGVQLLINDQLISVDLNGHFRDIVVVKGTGHNVDVEAMDPDGNKSSYPIEVSP
jgi:FecR-like protein